MKQCKQCQKEFESKTAAAEFCSGACRAQTARSRAQMKDLPIDVQAAIEKHCAENNGGARDASHSRQAMTERALKYQAKMGKQSVPTGKCQTCGGPVQHAKVVKCLTCCTGEKLPAPVPTPEPAESGPLSVYSDRRWAYLTDRGYVWVEEKQRAYRPGDGRTGLIMGVTVPGDPAYKGTESLSKAG